MEKNKYVFAIIFILTVHSLFGFSFLEDKYRIVNNSSTDIMVTAIPKDSVNREGIDFIKDGITISKIRLTTFLTSNKHLVSKDKINECSIFDMLPNYEIAASDIFRYLLKEFVVYDIEGYIIMTMNDITEEIFTRSERRMFSICITQEMVEAGRRKYAGRKE
jgi:hypothetical protein